MKVQKLKLNLREGKKKKTKKLKREAIEGEDGPASGNKKKRRRHQKKRLIMNVAQTKYYVVRYVGKKVYKMKLTRSDDEDWDVCW
jgi:hypothetical protein